MLADFLEAPGPEAVQLALLATDDCNDRPVRTRDERHERREMELAPDLDTVGDGLG